MIRRTCLYTLSLKKENENKVKRLYIRIVFFGLGSIWISFFYKQELVFSRL